jgi:hypothetical protein
LIGGGVEWIHLPQDMDLWRAVVNTVMNLEFWRHGISYSQCQVFIGPHVLA